MTTKNLIRVQGTINSDIRQIIETELSERIESYFNEDTSPDDTTVAYIRLYELHRIGDALEILSGIWDDEESTPCNKAPATESDNTINSEGGTGKAVDKGSDTHVKL